MPIIRSDQGRKSLACDDIVEQIIKAVREYCRFIISRNEVFCVQYTHSWINFFRAVAFSLKESNTRANLNLAEASKVVAMLKQY